MDTAAWEHHADTTRHMEITAQQHSHRKSSPADRTQPESTQLQHHSHNIHTRRQNIHYSLHNKPTHLHTIH
jgi:hypothetical protein